MDYTKAIAQARLTGEFYLDLQGFVLYIRIQFFRTDTIMKIALVGLSPGIHQLHFDEKPATWGLENHPNLRTNIRLDVHLEKTPTHLYLRNHVHTVGRFECDRCLEQFDAALDDTGRLMFSNDDELVQSSDDEIRALDPKAREIDITVDVRDLLLLAIPAKLLCREDCSGLCLGCGVNLNLESCRCSPRTADPRWQALQKFVDNSK